MKPAIVILQLLLVTLLVVPQSHARVSTNVNISNNGDNSHSSVKVNNSTNINVNGQSTDGSSCTKIRIEENGEVKEYDSCDGGSVHMESSSGNARVSINTGDASDDKPAASPKLRATPLPVSSPTPEPSPTPAASGTPSPTPTSSPTVTSQNLIFPPNSFFDELTEFLEKVFAEYF